MRSGQPQTAMPQEPQTGPIATQSAAAPQGGTAPRHQGEPPQGGQPQQGTW
jgi:hypothetical protein